MLRLRVGSSVWSFKEIEIMAGLGNISKGRVCGVVVGEDKGESFTTQKSEEPWLPKTSPSFDSVSPAKKNPPSLVC